VAGGSVFPEGPAKRADVGGMSVAYRVVGPGGAGRGAVPQTPAKRALLLICGSSGTMDGWPPELMAALAADRQVIAFDNRGMGLTANPTGPYQFSQLADDAAGLVRALGCECVDVLGWSMGGSVAIDLTVRHPDVVGSLISYAGSAGGSHAAPPRPEALAVLTDTSPAPEERGMRLLELLFAPGFRAAHPDYASLFPIPTEETEPEQIGLQNAAIGEWEGVWDGLPGIRKPALFVTGMEDVIAPPDNAAMLAKRVPGSWLVRIAGAGHGLMYQNPRGLAAIVLAFLAVSGA
jgi:pimeloyl-ACP methyl ester carboxylesterase